MSSAAISVRNCACDIQTHDDMAMSIWVAPSWFVAITSSRYHASAAVRAAKIQYGLDPMIANGPLQRLDAASGLSDRSGPAEPSRNYMLPGPTPRTSTARRQPRSRFSSSTKFCGQAV